MNIYLMRHGQTEKNKARLLQGRSDVPLNETGMEEARRTADWFGQQGIRFDAVYSSPLIRAVQTAQLASGCKEIRVDERLLEMDYGPYEGMDLSDPAPEIITFFSDFVHNPAPEGMEPLSSVVHRMGEFLEDLQGQEGNILIVTHAVAMKGALEYLTPESGGSYWSKYIGTCGVYAAEWKDSGFTIPEEIVCEGSTTEGV